MKISVCIITYNHENYIKKCIESALIQKTNYSFEIIIGEDCSTDKTRAICEEFSIKHPKLIRLLPVQPNLGMIGNWKRSILSCRGEYISICEGDDYWSDPYKLQKQVDFLEANKNYSIHSGNAYALKENELVLNPLIKEERQSTFSFLDFIYTNHLITCTVMFRNEKIKFPEIYDKLKYGDWFLYLLLLENGSKAFYSNEFYSVYRIHSGGVFNSQNEITQLKNKIEYLNEIHKYFKNKKYSKNLIQEYNSLFFRLSKTYFIEKQILMSFKTLCHHIIFLKTNFSVKHYAYQLKKYLKRKIYVS